MQHLPGIVRRLGPLRVACVLYLALGCSNQKQAAREQITDLQRLALHDAEVGRAPSARKRLLAAMRLGKDAALTDDDPVTVRTYMSLGGLYAQLMKDDRRALAYLYAGVSTDPNAKLPNVLSGARARKVLAQARSNAARAAAKATDSKAAPAAAKIATRASPASRAVASNGPVYDAATARPRAPLRGGPPSRSRADVGTNGPVYAAAAGPPTRRLTARERRRQAALARAAARKDAREARAARLAAARDARAGRLAAARAARAGKGADPQVEVIDEPPPPPPAPPERKPVPLAEQPPGRSAAAERTLASAAPPPDQVPVPLKEPAEAPAPVALEAAPPAAPPPPDPPPAPVRATTPLPPPTFPTGQADPIYCPLPIEAPPRHEVVVRCAVRPDLRSARLTLHYRPSGSETFTAVSMPRSRNGVFQGVVPVAATDGKSVQFFIEAGGPQKVTSGSSDSPNVLVLREGATPVGQKAAATEETAAEPKADEPEEAAALAERIRKEDDDPLAASELRREASVVRRRPPGKLWIGLQVGSGYGFQPGAQLEFRQNKRVDAGPLSGGLVHALPEIGYQLSDRFSLSVQTRFQYAPVDGSGDPLPGNPPQSATAFLLRGMYNIGDGPLHAFVSAAGGWGKGGAFRLIVPADPAAERPRSDTVRSGPFVVGGGIGLAYHFTRRIAWPLEVRTLIGFPDFAAVLEGGTGIAVSF